PPEGKPLVSAIAFQASIRSVLAPTGDTCAPSLRPCPLWPPRFPDSFPLFPRQTTSSPACLSPNFECRQEYKTRAWLLSLIGNSNCRWSGVLIVAHQSWASPVSASKAPFVVLGSCSHGPLWDENISGKFEPSAQFPHLFDGEIPLPCQEY